MEDNFQVLLNSSHTRSGAGYSPWVEHLGVPIELDIDVAPLAHAAAQNAVATLDEPDEQNEDDAPTDRRTSLRSWDSLSAPKEDLPNIPKPTESRKDRDKARSKARRRSARLAKSQGITAHGPARPNVKQVSVKRRQAAKAVSRSADIASPHKDNPTVQGPKGFSNNPVASSGFVGRRMPAQKGNFCRDMSKADALALKFEYVEWDGCEPRAMVDKAGRVFAVLAGRPKDAVGWEQVNAEVQKAFNDARSSCGFDDTLHRRGTYPTLTTGVSFGGGQTHPTNINSTKKKEQHAVEKLLNNPYVRRLAGFGDSCFRLYAPRLYQYYATTLESLLANDNTLHPSFEKSVFCGTTFNLGPKVATYVHTDHQNLPAGWCAVTAIGQFDPKAGGHLLLWDLNLMIEFPPGALILIPSAILRHSNTVVGPEESRHSFTQYSAGGIFRWVECGCKTQKRFDREGRVHAITGSERWLRGVDMWSKWDELQETE